MVAAAGVVATLASLAVLRPGLAGALALAALCGGFLWWCLATRYVVRVTGERLELRFAPLRVRRVPVTEVVGCVAHMAYPWGEGPRGPRRVVGVDCWRAGAGAGVVVELDGGTALWVDCAHPERLAAVLRGRRPRR